MAVHRFSVQQTDSQVIRYRVVKEDGNLVAQSDVSSILLYVWETETGLAANIEDGETVNKITAVFNTAQDWDVDEEGFNFRIAIDGSYLSNYNRTYRVEVKVTPTTGTPYYLDHVDLTPTVRTYSA